MYMILLIMIVKIMTLLQIIFILLNCQYAHDDSSKVYIYCKNAAISSKNERPSSQELQEFSRGKAGGH